MVAKLSLLLVVVIFGLVESRPDWNLVLKARSDGSEQGGNSGHGDGSLQDGDSQEKSKVDPSSPMNHINTLLGQTMDYLMTDVDLSKLLNDLKGGFKKLLSDVQAIIDSGEKPFLKDPKYIIKVNDKFMVMDLKLATDFMYIVDEMNKNELQSPAAGGSFKFVDSCLKAFADQVWKDGDQVHNLNTIVGHSFGCLKTSVDIIVKGAFSELPKILDENVDKEARKEALTSLIVFIEDVTEEIAYVSKIVEKLIEVSHYGSNTNAALVFAKCSFENLNREMESREDCEDKALATKGIPTPKPTPTSSPPTTPEQQPAEKRQKILRELKNMLQVLNKKKVF